jgi:hypothetical protein
MAEIEIVVTTQHDRDTQSTRYVPSMKVDGIDRTPKEWQAGCGSVKDLVNFLRNQLETPTAGTDSFKWRGRSFDLPDALGKALAQLDKELASA